MICQIEIAAELRNLKTISFVRICPLEIRYANMLTTKTPPSDSSATLLRSPVGNREFARADHRALNQPLVSNSSDPFGIPAVFVVDDDAEMRESLELLLLTETFPVETYESGDAFWDDFHPERRGCMVLDLRMPGMGGLALLKLLAETDHQLSIVVVSASADPHEKAQALELGALAFLTKPYDSKKLLGMIREQLSQ